MPSRTLHYSLIPRMTSAAVFEPLYRSLPVFLLVLAVGFLSACSSDSNGGGNSGPAVEITDIVEGTGRAVFFGQTLITTFEGRLPDGTVFHSSELNGEDLTFTLGVGQGLRGWDEGLQGMLEGGTRRLVIPPEKGFGDEEFCIADGGCVPPNTVVTYDFTVKEIFDTVKITQTEPGEGRTAEFGDIVFMDFFGFCTSGGPPPFCSEGELFDASNLAGGDFFFTIGGGTVIPGFEQGVLGMQVGSSRSLLIPPNLAYGGSGVRNLIPPWQVIRFEVTLKEIVKPGE